MNRLPLALDVLSATETRVVYQIVNGASISEASVNLGKARNTVRKQLTRALKKLDAEHQRELIVRYWRDTSIRIREICEPNELLDGLGRATKSVKATTDD